MGMTFVILIGSIDLSVEGAVSVSAMVLVLLAANDANSNDYGWLAVLAAIAASDVMGFMNGMVQTTCAFPPSWRRSACGSSAWASPSTCWAARRSG